MAFSLENIRSKILTSIHGRRLGIDPDGFLAGPKPLRQQVTDATVASAAAGTNLANHGVHTVVTSTNTEWTLTDPIPGVAVRIGTNSTSTGNHAIVPAAATITSTNGVAGSSITLQGIGASIELMGISTAQWLVTSRGGSTTAGATAIVSS